MSENLEARIAALQAENEKLKSKTEKKVTLKATPKGCVGIYGLRRMPITLYPQEVQKILDMEQEIRQFIEENKENLGWK